MKINVKKIAKISWRGLVVIFREVFTGLMLGISALLILVKLSPEGNVNVGYLVGLGLLAGVMKGLAKFILMELINKIPSDELNKNYPKYKMLILWVAIFALAALANYGFAFNLWLTEPARYIHEIFLVDNFPLWIVRTGLLTLFLLGLASYFYEPHYKD